MAFQKKAKKNVYLSPADIARIKTIDDNPWKEHRKLKIAATFKHPKIKAEIVKIVYGKDLDEIKASIKYDLAFFQKADKAWKIIKTEDLKADKPED